MLSVYLTGRLITICFRVFVGVALFTACVGGGAVVERFVT